MTTFLFFRDFYLFWNRGPPLRREEGFWLLLVTHSLYWVVTLLALTLSHSLTLLSVFQQVRVKDMSRPTVSRSVCLGVKPQLGPQTRFLLLSDSLEFVDVGRPFWQEDRSGVYNGWCHSPVRVIRTNDDILLSEIRDSPNLEGRVPEFKSPRNMRYGLALSIGPNRVGFTWSRRQTPVSETLCFEK
jgi:hypothetical protein